MIRSVQLGRYTFRRTGCPHCGEGVKSIEIVGRRDDERVQTISGEAAETLWETLLNARGATITTEMRR